MGIFFIGMALGVVILAFFFKGKGVEMCYFPNCRVLKDIRNKPITLDASIQNHGYSMEVLQPIFWNGEVDFGRSQTQSNPCKEYVITGIASDEQKLEIMVQNCPKKVFVISVKKVNSL